MTNVPAGMSTPPSSTSSVALAQAGEDDRGVPDKFLDGLRRQFRMVGQQRPLVGVVGQDLNRGGELVAGGVGSGVEQDRNEVHQFVVGQPVAVVFGADELGDQVVGQGVSPRGDQVLDVGLELLPRPQDGGCRPRRRCTPKALLMSSAQLENRCQSSRGAPSSAQMIGTGYWASDVGDHVAAACGVAGRSISSVMTSTHAVRIRSAARGVNALATPAGAAGDVRRRRG